MNEVVTTTNTSIPNTHIQRIYSNCIERYYNEVNGKRVYSSNKDECDNLERFQFYLHDWLHEDVWNRHELSVKDIIAVVEAMDAMNLWLLALAENFEVMIAAIKPSYDYESNTLVCTGRNVILNKLTERFQERYKHRQGEKYFHKLTVANSDFVPTPPLHKWSDEECIALRRAIGTDELRLDRTYANTYTWRGIELLPYSIHKKRKDSDYAYEPYLALARVVPRDIHYATDGTPTCIRREPFFFHVGTGEQKEVYCDKWENMYIYNENNLHSLKTYQAY